MSLFLDYKLTRAILDCASSSDEAVCAIVRMMGEDYVYPVAIAEYECARRAWLASRLETSAARDRRQSVEAVIPPTSFATGTEAAAWLRGWQADWHKAVAEYEACVEAEQRASREMRGAESALLLWADDGLEEWEREQVGPIL